MLDFVINELPPSLHIICALGVALGVYVFRKCRRINPDDDFAGVTPMTLIIGSAVAMWMVVAFMVAYDRTTSRTLETRFKPSIEQFLADHSTEEFDDWFTCDDFSRVGKLSDGYSRSIRSTSLVKDDEANEFYCYFDFRGSAHHFIVNLEDKQIEWID